MDCNTIQVSVSEDSVLTLQELTDNCKELYGWQTAEVHAGDIVFTDENGEKKMMDTNGDVYALDKDGEQGDLLETLDLAGDFDWTQHIWATDENGEPILIYQL